MKRIVRGLVFLAVIVAAGLFVWHEETEPTAQRPAGEQAAAEQPASGAAGRGGGRRGGRGGRGGGGGGEGPVSVLTAPARTADVPVTLEAVGTAQALNTVTVRSQVDGRLLELAFRDGQDVKRGDLLARVDPTIYQAQFDQAVAKKAQDEANLANARTDLVRYENLAKTNYGTKQQADTQRAQVAQLEAQAKADQGAIDNARAYLDYCTIVSPIDGRTGIRLVDAGNLVKAADTTGIVVITQVRPIYVVFNLPQQTLRAVNGALARGGLVPVDALEADDTTAVDRGALEVVDNQVDQLTGTVKLKATFPNDHLQLWPGAFTNVRVTVDTLRGATVVPTAAIQRGPNGTFVYEVSDGKATVKPVGVGHQDEAVSVVTAGLAAGEQVITTGFARLTSGDAVRVAEGPADATGAPPSGATAAPDAVARSDGGPSGSGERRRRRRDGRPEGQAAPVPAGTAGAGAASGDGQAAQAAPGVASTAAGTAAPPAGGAGASAGGATDRGATTP